MAHSLTDYIKVYDEVFPKEVCEDLILAYKENLNHVQTHKTAGYIFNQLEINTTPTIKDVADPIYRTLIPRYQDYFEELECSDYVNLGQPSVEALRIKKYKKNSGEQFKTHVDVVDHETARRYAVAIVYLNDNDGATVFPTIGMKVEAKQGRVVIFPPNWMFPHAGLEPTNHDKYIMMTCLHYT